MLDHIVDQMEVGMKSAAKLPSTLKASENVLPGLLDVSKLKELPKLIAPSTPFIKAISSEPAFGTATLSIKRAKAVGKAAWGKLNDVVLALESRILRRHLLSIGALTEKPLEQWCQSPGVEMAIAPPIIRPLPCPAQLRPILRMQRSA